MTQTKATEDTVRREEEFVAHLWNLVEDGDRAALAALRRGAGKGPGEVAEPLPVFYRRLPYGLSQHQEDAYYLVATLFALWSQGAMAASGMRDPPRDLGASMARLQAEAEGEGPERRFIALLNTHQEDLAYHLRAAVSLLRSKEIPVGWTALLLDIQRWSDPRRTVQRRWARSFWLETRTQAVQPAEGDET